MHRDGNSGACPRAWPGNAHGGAGLGKDIVARFVAGLAGQDRDGTGPKAGCGKTLRPATLFSFVSLVINRDNRVNGEQVMTIAILALCVSSSSIIQ